VIAEKTKQAHAFVTGAGGFIGKNLVEELLRQHYSVGCLVRSPAKTVHIQDKNIELVMGDLNNPECYKEQIQKADIVFHVAGVTKTIRKSVFFTGNLETTRQLVKLVSHHAPKHQKIVYISSQAAAGPCAQTPGVNEFTPDSRPVSAYGKSKRAAEKEILSIADQFPVVILRPSIVFGPWDHGMEPLFKAISYGIKIKSGFRDFPVNLIYVADLVKAIILAGRSVAANGKTFYVTDGQSYTWGHLLNTIATHVNPRAVTLTIPLPIIWGACQVGGLMGTLLSRPQDLNPDKWFEIKQDGWLCNTSYIQKELGFHSRYSLDDSIRESLNWYRNPAR